MTKCEFAIWHPLKGNGSTHLGGPAKIVHHTTEGGTAEGAFATFTKEGSTPHFTVDSKNIWQHIDTDNSAYSLENLKGGVQTNRDGAIQIEVVGFAHLPKGLPTLRNVALLCRWIEGKHQVPRQWPNGKPKPANGKGKDPGGHNRDANTWNTVAGHYGHCHVPENIHWDPGYLSEEADFLLADSAEIMTMGAAERHLPEEFHSTPSFEGVESTMPDHGSVHGDD